MDARQIHLKTIDAIAAFDVLEHIKENDVVLSTNASEALRKMVCLTVPPASFLWSYADDMPVTFTSIATGN